LVDGALNLSRHGFGVGERKSAVESDECLIDAEWLDLRREAEIEIEQLDRERDVFVGIAFDVFGAGTQASSFGERHSGADAERARFVGGCGDDAAARRIAAHDHRAALEARMMYLLDRGEEGVHADQKDHAMALTHRRARPYSE